MKKSAAIWGAVLLLLLAAGAAPSGGAPAPTYKPKPAPQVAAGRWVLVWSGVRYDMTLWAGGAYEAALPGGGCRWAGSWRWCPEARVLTISETDARSLERRLCRSMSEGLPFEHGLTVRVRMPPGSLLGGRGFLGTGGAPVAISLEPAGEKKGRPR